MSTFARLTRTSQTPVDALQIDIHPRFGGGLLLASAATAEGATFVQDVSPVVGAHFQDDEGLKTHFSVAFLRAENGVESVVERPVGAVDPETGEYADPTGELAEGGTRRRRR